MRAWIAAAVLALALSSPPATAQQTDAERAAERLVAIVLTPEIVDGVVDRMVDTLVESQPRLQPYRDVLRAFYERHLGHGPMSGFMAEVYADNFSAGEMDEIRAFYETPTGRKAKRLMPRLFRIGARWGREQVMAHRDELIGELEAAAERRRGSAAE